MTPVELMLEAERRGILPEHKKPLLAEARRRGLVPGGSSDAVSDLDRAMDARTQREVARFGDIHGGSAAAVGKQGGLGGSITDEINAGISAGVDFVTGGRFGDVPGRGDTQMFPSLTVEDTQDDKALAEKYTPYELSLARERARARHADKQFGTVAKIALALPFAAVSSPAVKGATALGTAAKTGAVYGGVHGFGRGEGGFANRVGTAGTDAAVGAVAGPVLQKGFEKTAQAYMGGRNALAARKQAKVDKVREKQRVLEDAGLPSDQFGPAVTSSGAAQTVAQGLASTPMGQSLVKGAKQMVGKFEERAQALLGSQTGRRSTHEMGEDTQQFLETQLTKRSVPDEAMTVETAQDLTGLPLPQSYKPKPVKVERVQPEPVEPVTPDVYLQSVRDAIPDQKPSYQPGELPRLFTPDEFRQTPQASPHTSAASAKRAELESRAQAHTQDEAASQAADAALQSALKNAGLKVRDTGDGYFEIVGRGEPIRYYPDGQRDRISEKMATAAAIKQRQSLHWSREAPQAVRVSEADEAFVEPFARKIVSLRGTKQGSVNKRSAIDRLRAEIAQIEADDIKFQSGARSQADEETTRLYREAVAKEQARVKDTNDLSRRSAEAEAAARTDAAREAAIAREMPEASRRAESLTKGLRAQAKSKADAETAKRKALAEAEQAQDIAARKARDPQSFQLGAAKAGTYKDEIDAAYRMADEHTPSVQVNPLGAQSVGNKTSVTRVLDSMALEGRAAGKLPGYKEGQLFDEAGAIKPNVLQYLKSRLGDEVGDQIASHSTRRSANQFSPGIKGMHANKTAIGKEIGDAKKFREPGMPRGPDEAALARYYTALDDDIASARIAGGGDASLAMRRAIDEQFKRHREEVLKPLGALFGKRGGKDVAPIDTMDDLANAAERGDLTILKPYARVLEQKGKPEEGAAMVVSHMANGAKDFKSFMDGFGKWSPAVRDVMFRGKAGRDLRVSLENLERAGKLLESSGTVSMAKQPQGFNTSVFRQLSRPGSAVTVGAAYFAGLWSSIAGIGGSAMMARFMSSPQYVRWMTALPRVAKQGRVSPAMKAHMARLAVIAESDELGGKMIEDAVKSTLGGQEQ